jgi:uncharacterized protein
MMQWSDAQLIIDALFIRDDSELPVNINFFGGEPMLAWSLIEKYVLYAEDLGKRQGCAVSFSMTTNVTRVTDERAEFMRRHDFTVLISIDGTRKDLARPDTRGYGSWEKVSAGSKNLLKILGNWRFYRESISRLAYINLTGLYYDS